VTSSNKIDSNLGRKILKSILNFDQSEEPNLDQSDSFKVAALVYSSTQLPVELPAKFVDLAISGFLGDRIKEPEVLLKNKKVKKLVTKLIEAAVTSSFNTGNDQSEVTNQNYATFIKAMLPLADFEIDDVIIQKLLESNDVIENNISKIIFSYLEEKDSNILKRLSDWSKLDQVTNLPPEVLIYHDEPEVRLAAINKIKTGSTTGSQRLFRSILKNDSSNKILEIALGQIDKNSQNISLICDVINKMDQSRDSGLNALIECHVIEKYDTAKIAAYIITYANDNHVTQYLQKIGIAGGQILKFSNLNDVIKIIQNQKLFSGLKYILKVSLIKIFL